MTTENTPANEVRLYPRFKHTVLCQIEYDGETEAQPWADLDVYSDAEDPRTALLAYLREGFETRDIKESRDGVLSLADTAFADGVTRHYRTKG